MGHPLPLPEPNRKENSSPLQLPQLTLPAPQQVQQRRLSAALEESRVSVPTVFDHEEDKSSAAYNRRVTDSTSDVASTRRRESSVAHEYSIFNLDGDVASSHHASGNAPRAREHGFLHNLFHHRSSNHDREATPSNGATMGAPSSSSSNGGKSGTTRRRNELLQFFTRRAKPDAIAARRTTTSKHHKSGHSAPAELSASQLQRPLSQSYSRYAEARRRGSLRASAHTSPLPSPRRGQEEAGRSNNATSNGTANNHNIAVMESNHTNTNDDVDSHARLYSFYAESGIRGTEEIGAGAGAGGDTGDGRGLQSRSGLLSMTYDSFMWGDGDIRAATPHDAMADAAEGRNGGNTAEGVDRAQMPPTMTNHAVLALPTVADSVGGAEEHGRAGTAGAQGNGPLLGGNLTRRQRRSLMHTNSISETDTNNSRYFGQIDAATTPMNGGSRHSGRAGSQYSTGSQTSFTSVGPTGLPPTTRPFRWMPYATNPLYRFTGNQGKVPFMMNVMQAVHGARYGMQNLWANALNRNETRTSPQEAQTAATAAAIRRVQAPEYVTEEDVATARTTAQTTPQSQPTPTPPEPEAKPVSGVAAINEAAAAMNMETLHLTDSVVKATNEVKLHSFYGPIGTLGLVASQNRAQWERATGNEGIAERIYVLMSNDREGTGPAKSQGNILLLTRMWCDPHILWDAPYVDSPNWSDAEELAAEQEAEKKADKSAEEGSGEKAKPRAEEANGGGVAAVARATGPGPKTLRDRAEPTPSVNAMNNNNNNANTTTTNNNNYTPGSFSMLPRAPVTRGDEAGAADGTQTTLTTTESKRSTPVTRPGNETRPGTASQPATMVNNTIVPPSAPRPINGHRMTQKPSLFAAMRTPRPVVRETATATTTRTAPAAARAELASFFCEVHDLAEDEAEDGNEDTSEEGNRQERHRYGDGAKGRRAGRRTGQENDSSSSSGAVNNNNNDNDEEANNNNNNNNNNKSEERSGGEENDDSEDNNDSDADETEDEEDYVTEIGSDRYSFMNNSADSHSGTVRGSRHRVLDGNDGAAGNGGRANETRRQQQLLDDSAMGPHSRVSSAREFANREEAWLSSFVKRDSEGRLTTRYDVARQNLEKDYPGLDELLIGDQTSDALSDVTGGSRRNWRHGNTAVPQRGPAPTSRAGRSVIEEGRGDGTSRQAQLRGPREETTSSHTTPLSPLTVRRTTTAGRRRVAELTHAPPRQPNYMHTPSVALPQSSRGSLNEPGRLPLSEKAKAQASLATKSPLIIDP